MSIHTLLLKVQHHLGLVLAVVAVFLLLLVVLTVVLRKRPRTLDQREFSRRWHDLQKHLPTKNTWPIAVIDADKLLDEALKRRKFKGKTMGERLVSAQRELSSNDTVWFGHKLRNKLVHEDYNLARKEEVKSALLGYLQALKDLGAIKNDKQ